MLYQIRIHFAGSFAVTAAEIKLGLFRQHFVTLSGKHIDCRLSADNLRKRRAEWWIAEIPAYHRNFGKHFVNAVQDVHLLELTLEVGEHATGNLVTQYADIDASERALELFIFDAHLFEIIVNLGNQSQVKSRVARCAAQLHHERFNRRMAGTERQRRHIDVKDVDAGACGLPVSDRSHPAGAVSLKMHRNVNIFLKCTNAFIN